MSYTCPGGRTGSGSGWRWARSGPTFRPVVLRASMLLASIGVLPGIAAAPGAEQLISFLLFGLAPYNVPTIAAATGVMVVVPAIAGFMPARSPSHVDPMVALHDE